MNDYFKQFSDIVLVGSSDCTSKIIKSLNKNYDICPVLFAHTKPAPYNIFLNYSFVKQLYPENCYYNLHMLLDIYNNFEGKNVLLVPCDLQFNKTVSDNIEILEKYYVISDIDNLYEKLFSYYIKKGCKIGI